LSSATLNEAILLLACIVTASGFSAYAIYSAGLLRNNIAQTLNEMQRASDLRVEVVYACVNGSTFVIYVKNTGYLPITDYRLIDVYVGPYGYAKLYTYSPTASPGCFTLSDVDGDGSWAPRETAVITVHPENGVPSATMYEVLVKPSSGTGSRQLFPPPP